MARPAPGQNPNLHAPRQSAGYSRGAVIGDGARARYRPPEPADYRRPYCDRCGAPGANCLVPKPDDPQFLRWGWCFCQPCATEYSTWRRAQGLLP